MMNPLAPRLALLFAVEGVEQEVRLSLAAKALPVLAEEVAEMRLSLAAKATHSDCPTS